jgi:hypothetical protein
MMRLEAIRDFIHPLVSAPPLYVVGHRQVGSIVFAPRQLLAVQAPFGALVGSVQRAPPMRERGACAAAPVMVVVRVARPIIVLLLG